MGYLRLKRKYRRMEEKWKAADDFPVIN